MANEKTPNEESVDYKILSDEGRWSFPTRSWPMQRAE